MLPFSYTDRFYVLLKKVHRTFLSYAWQRKNARKWKGIFPLAGIYFYIIGLIFCLDFEHQVAVGWHWPHFFVYDHFQLVDWFAQSFHGGVYFIVVVSCLALVVFRSGMRLPFFPEGS